MKKMLAITALCLFGFYGVTQGQALAGPKPGGAEKTPLVSLAPTSDDVGNKK